MSTSAEILKRFTGSDVFVHEHNLEPGSARIEPGGVPTAGVTLSWASFSDAADEAGMSRRDGGIHWADGDLDARAIHPWLA